MKNNNWLKHNIFLLIIIVIDSLLIILLWLAASHSNWIENYYSKLIYPSITKALSSFSDLFSFSLSEVVLIILLVLSIVWIIYLLISFIRKKKSFLEISIHAIKTIIITGSILITIFYLTWGLNFFRVPLKERSLLNQKKVTTKHFYDTLNKMIAKANNLYISVTPSFDTINSSVEKGLSSVIKEFDGYKMITAKRGKKLFFNFILERSLVTGITSPFFHEIHYNSNLLPAELPMTLAHEKAHLHGYTSEGEANFIAYLSCKRSENRFSQFSAEVMAIRYFLYQLINKRELTKYREYRSKLRPEILTIYKTISKRIKQNRGFLSSIQSKMNNFYLKANKIKKGVEDYSEIIFFILSYEEKL